jgi:preprotein translocase subunit SecE
LSSQDTAAPKRRSAAANRRRRRHSDAQANLASTTPSVAADQLDESQAAVAADDEKLTRSARKAAARETPAAPAASALPQEKHLRRKQERREAKSRRPEKKSGVGRLVNTERFSGVQGFYQASALEIRKVIWPDREATRNLTVLVIALSTILGLLLGGIDYVLFQIFEAMSLHVLYSDRPPFVAACGDVGGIG